MGTLLLCLYSERTILNIRGLIESFVSSEFFSHYFANLGRLTTVAQAAFTLYHDSTLVLFVRLRAIYRQTAEWNQQGRDAGTTAFVLGIHPLP